jgi:hypothetical protein
MLSRLSRKNRDAWRFLVSFPADSRETATSVLASGASYFSPGGNAIPLSFSFSLSLSSP